MKEAFAKLEDMGLVPTLDKNETYDAEETKLAEEIGIPVEIYQKAQAFTVKKSTEEMETMKQIVISVLNQGGVCD